MKRSNQAINRHFLIGIYIFIYLKIGSTRFQYISIRQKLTIFIVINYSVIDYDQYNLDESIELWYLNLVESYKQKSTQVTTSKWTILLKKKLFFYYRLLVKTAIFSGFSLLHKTVIFYLFFLKLQFSIVKRGERLKNFAKN